MCVCVCVFGETERERERERERGRGKRERDSPGPAHHPSIAAAVLLRSDIVLSAMRRDILGEVAATAHLMAARPPMLSPCKPSIFAPHSRYKKDATALAALTEKRREERREERSKEREGEREGGVPHDLVQRPGFSPLADD